MDKYFYMNPKQHDGNSPVPAAGGAHSCMNCKHGKQKAGAMWCAKYSEELGERKHCVSWEAKSIFNR